MKNDVLSNMYMTYLREVSKKNLEAVSKEKFKEAFQKSQKYMKRLYRMSRREFVHDGVHPCSIVPIDGTMFLLTQLNDGVVDVGIHEAHTINKLVGKHVLDV